MNRLKRFLFNMSDLVVTQIISELCKTSHLRPKYKRIFSPDLDPISELDRDRDRENVPDFTRVNCICKVNVKITDQFISI